MSRPVIKITGEDDELISKNRILMDISRFSLNFSFDLEESSNEFESLVK